jgi:hypothetical protein
LLIEKYAQLLGCGTGYHGQTQLYQDAVFLRKHLHATDENPGVSGTHPLYFLLQQGLCFLCLLFKQVVPDHGAISWTAWQFALTYVECVQEVNLDQVKVHGRELFVLINGAESYESGHVVFTG